MRSADRDLSTRFRDGRSDLVYIQGLQIITDADADKADNVSVGNECSVLETSP